MKHKEYWERRFEALEEAQMQKGADYYARLEKQYRRAQRTVQKDIETWYARLAVNNELTLQGARKLLTADELEEFHWNVMEYIEKGRTLNISDQWAKQLENASAKFHISRLEAIKLQMQNHIEVLYGTEHDEFASLMENIYTEGYYHTAYEIQKGFGIGYDLMRLDKNKVEKVLSKPWAADGSNFSSRIWSQKAQLVNELETQLTQAIIQGKNPSVVTDIIAKRFEVSKGKAGRLVMTEAAFFNSASNRDCYKELDVEQYEILATLDRKTSDICQELDGKVFKMSEYAVGVTAPPFHTWCRTTTVPFFDDEFELGSKRAARGDDGKTYHVPADMKYEDWKKTFVDGGSKEALEKMAESGIIEIDELTPCLRRLSDDKIVNTSVFDVSPTKEEFKDWEFDWTIPKKNGLIVRGIKADGDDRMQGMIALKSDPSNYAVVVDIVEAAPFNNPHNKLFTKKEYAGVGGHLFAEAVRESINRGYDGYVYFKAKTNLIEHYQKELGAILINEKERIMAIDERGAKILYDRYYKER